MLPCSPGTSLPVDICSLNSTQSIVAHLELLLSTNMLDSTTVPLVTWSRFLFLNGKLWLSTIQSVSL
ncbi:hypothetical protein HMI54_003239 [Coelomomyces lativittatus]|nr:hypothetical protein HMI54_003239 [Coelomomyces lativittatus]